MLLRLRQDGILLIAKADGLDNRQLYLASACDRVVVSPPGEVSAVGVSAHSTFFGAALERLGLRFDVEAAGAYKSFGETFTRRGPSPESREATVTPGGRPARAPRRLCRRGASPSPGPGAGDL
ncbi:MAG: S49 family peptidase [Deltaproteobacteria bacterium]|nr:S49 family peptidase [Deltaproteobacteria bacterium]